MDSFLIILYTCRLRCGRYILSCWWSFTDTVSHSHANRIIRVRFEILEHIVISVLGNWYILSIEYNILIVTVCVKMPSLNPLLRSRCAIKRE